jgi:hypothetical protein
VVAGADDIDEFAVGPEFDQRASGNVESILRAGLGDGKRRDTGG